MLNRLIMAASVVLGAAAGYAAPLTPAEALARLDNSEAYENISPKGAKTSQYRLALTESIADTNTVYVFNRGKEAGFVVVSADDDALPLLGYSDKGMIPTDRSQLPDGFLYWIEMLSQRVAAAKSNPSTAIARKARPERTAIEPLCTTKWNQGEPFNNTCPASGGQRCYTGCVATAMAQAMKYHNWPETGEGSNSYQWGRYTLSQDFSAQTWKWDKMLDEYTQGNYTDEEASAVAKIMRSAGISVDMNYSTSGSGAVSMNIAPALGNHFRYDKSTLAFHQRDYYYLYDWEDLIYSSLKEDGPVIYDGQSYIGGHSFICDGYQGDGYFHFNWGWGGTSDGWFLLDALDPLEQGIGGSGSNSGFNFQQDVIIGIRPDRNGESSWSGKLVAQGALTVDTDSRYKAGDELTISGMVYNAGPGNLPADTELGLCFRPGDGAEPILFCEEIEEEVYPLYGFSDITLEFPELADGRYFMTLGYRLPGEEWSDVEIPVYDSKGYNLTVEDGEATLAAQALVELESTGFEFKPTGVMTPFTATATVTNPSDSPFFSFIDALLLDEEGNLVAVSRSMPWDMEAGETREMEFRSEFTTPVTAGDYYICLATETSTEYLPFTELLPLNVPDPTGAVESVELESEAPAEYYDLNGVRVAEPGRGALVIRRQGGKAALRLR